MLQIHPCLCGANCSLCRNDEALPWTPIHAVIGRTISYESSAVLARTLDHVSQEVLGRALALMASAASKGSTSMRTLGLAPLATSGMSSVM